MNTRTFVKLFGFLFFFGMAITAEAQWGWQSGRQWGLQNLGSFPPYGNGWFGVSNGRRISPLGKMSISSDINSDGVIRYREDASLKVTPPGLVVGTNEMTKVLLSCIPDPTSLPPTVGSPKVKMKYHKLAVILDVRGVDLGKKNGQFGSIEKEIEKCGRILVWADKDRKNLLLDSADSSRRRLVWAYADSVPLHHVYVEGVKAAEAGGSFLITWELDDSFGQNAFQRFFGEPSVWDRLMVSVRPLGSDKPLIDSDPVWIRFSQPAYSKN